MSEPITPRPASRRRRLALPVVVAGAAASLLLALSLSPSVAAFTAQIANNGNTAATGTLAMKESSGTATCTSGPTGAATCATINKYGGNTAMVPGGAPVVTTVTITNTGTAPANTFTLAPGACTSAPTSQTANLCDKLRVVVAQDGTQIYAGTAAGFTAVLSRPALAAGASSTFTFSVSIDSSADNAYQGLTASQPLVWQFSS
ncbi:hypothetical protein [Microbacterium luticocti]|uniref:hypothetical protein n=1 Tax=Microbacterium luticocti TaxID=451764 RepID=UPI0003FD68F8|nr:hypothetical protein [Microbacterium luticocti]